MHGVNTIIGKITTFPPIKATITKNSRIVSFFNSLHYWGGQLEELSKGKGVTCGMKTTTELRFYALILQVLSVQEHKAVLTELCGRDDAQHMMNGLTPVSKDVVTTVFNLGRWSLTSQLIRICKPLVDLIGDIESRDSTLADCMLQLIFAHQAVPCVYYQDGDDPEFANHARRVLNTQFHAMNTDIHWFTLFLHPLCRKLAISSAAHSRKLEDALKIALDIAKCWNWSRETAENLVKDVKAYYLGHAPFAGGKANGKLWWEDLTLATASLHPL